jgi:hypothetical protein
MMPAALLADPEGLEAMLAVAREAGRAAKRDELAQRLAAGERGGSLG